MLDLSWSAPKGVPLRALFLGAHSDDIEIGCGATVRQWLSAGVRLDATWVVLSAEGIRAEEARRSAEDFLKGAAASRVVIGGFRDGFLPYLGTAVKDFFETLTAHPAPDVIFTHRRKDMHQDHRLVCELTYNTFRDHQILEYEIPKWDGDTGAPNAFVFIGESVARQKVDLVMRHFGTQRGKDWFDPETFLGLMRLRGMECRAPERYAEAFFVHKQVIGIPSTSR
jgi:LmbE family N-acetylglucosaminyl deacetylase